MTAALTEADIAGQVALRYNGDPRKPEKLGFIPGITPYPGLETDEYVVVDDKLLKYLKRPLGDQGQVDFAEFVSGVYNRNYPFDKWSVVLSFANEIEEPEQVQSEVKQTEPEHDDDDVSFIRRIFSSDSEEVGGADEAGNEENK